MKNHGKTRRARHGALAIGAALAVCGTSPQSAAQEAPAGEEPSATTPRRPMHAIRVSVGGYMEQSFGAASNRAGVRTFDGVVRTPATWAQMSDTEIVFTGRTALASGLVVGFNVQLEGNTQSDQIDESYLFVEGAFGRLVLGSENDAAYTQHVSAARPAVGWGILESAATSWVMTPRFTTFLTTTAPLTTGDDQKVTYFTPRLGGLQLGASFTPQAIEDDNRMVDRRSLRTDAWTLSANYTGALGPPLAPPWAAAATPVKLQASAGIVKAPPVDAAAASTPDLRAWLTDWAIGAQLELGGLALGAGYRRVDNNGGLQDGRVWAAGLAYARGPAAAGVALLDSNVAGNRVPAAPDRGRVMLLSGGVSLAPGIDLFASLFGVEFKGEDPRFGREDNNKGAGLVAGLRLSF